MKKKFLLIISILGFTIPYIDIADEIISKESVISPQIDTTREESIIVESEKLPERVIEQQERIKTYCENLVFNILRKDKDTGELPEALFYVHETDEDLEKLIVLKEKGLSYLVNLLKDLRNGYLRAYIIESLEIFTPNEEIINTLVFSLKDRSSQVRFLSARLLGKIGNPNIIPKLIPLLYDKYTLRKDVYPVRIAAREAIDLIKLREEIKNLQDDETRVKKLVEIVKDKINKKEDYFYEYATLEIPKYFNAKDILWEELNLIKSKGSKITQIENKIFGFFIEVLSRLQDERVLPIIEDALKDPSLFFICLRSLNEIKPDRLVDILLKEPINSDIANLIINLIEKKGKESNTLEYEIQKDLNTQDYKNYIEKIQRLLLLRREEDTYKKIAKFFAYGLNDYKRGLSYLKLYEDYLEGYDEEYITILSDCLANLGRFADAKEINPMKDVSIVVAYLPLIDAIQKKLEENTELIWKKLWYLYIFYKNIEEYKNAEGVLLRLINIKEGNEVNIERLNNELEFCRERIKEVEKNLSLREEINQENLVLEIKAEKDLYKIGEDINIKILIRNNSDKSFYILNDVEGSLGFDLIVMNDGILVKRLKTNFGKQVPIETLMEEVFEIEPHKSMEADITLKGYEYNEGEYEIILSYIGGKPISGYEDGWIESPLISNNILIKIQK